MDYIEETYKVLVTVVLGWFWLDKKNVRDDIKALEEKINSHATNVAVLEERLKSVKEDTTYIREKLGD